MGMSWNFCSAVGALVLLSIASPVEAQTFAPSGQIVWDEGGPHRVSRHSRHRVEDAPRSYAGIGPRPRRWCGWWMRTQKGGGPEFNVAWNWRKWGSPSGPQVGAVVVWRHHVGIITGRTERGQWIVRSGNDGGRVRERPRSVAGAIFRVGS